MSFGETDPPRANAYLQRVEDVLATLGTDAKHGLSEEEAQARLKQCGRNELLSEERPPMMEEVFCSVS